MYTLPIGLGVVAGATAGDGDMVHGGIIAYGEKEMVKKNSKFQ